MAVPRIWAQRQASGQEVAAGTGGQEAWHRHGDVRVAQERREHAIRKVNVEMQEGLGEPGEREGRVREE